MLKNFEYSMLPFGFVHCFCNNCRKADQCLRNLTLSYVPDTEVTVKMINPHLVVPDGKCPYYLSSKTKKFAYGISHLFDELPFGKVKKCEGRTDKSLRTYELLSFETEGTQFSAG